MAGSNRFTNNYRVSTEGREVTTTDEALLGAALVDGTEYEFQVRTNPGSQSYISAMTRAVVGIPLTGLKATSGDAQATLSWNTPGYPPGDTDNPVTGYQYRQSTDGGDTWDVLDEDNEDSAGWNEMTAGPVTDA